MTTYREQCDTGAARKLSWPRSWRSSPPVQAAAEVHRLRRQQRRTSRRRPRPGSADPARHHLPGHRARRARAWPAPTSPVTWRLHGVHPGDPYELLRRSPTSSNFKRPPARVLVNIVRSIGIEHLKPIAPPPQEALPRWRRFAEGLRHSKTRDAEAIHHHYDVSNTFYEWVLGPSMTYTCACYPQRRRDAGRGAGEQVPPGVREAAPAARRPAARRRLRLGRHGALRRPPRRQGDRRHAVARAGRPGRRRRSPTQGLADLAEVRHSDYRDVAEERFRRRVLDRPDRAHRRGRTTRRTSGS